MKVFVLITSNNNVGGIYSNKDKLVSDFSSIYSDTEIDRIEVWNTDGQFVRNLKISRKTTITIEE